MTYHYSSLHFFSYSYSCSPFLCAGSIFQHILVCFVLYSRAQRRGSNREYFTRDMAIGMSSVFGLFTRKITVGSETLEQKDDNKLGCPDN